MSVLPYTFRQPFNFIFCFLKYYLAPSRIWVGTRTEYLGSNGLILLLLLCRYHNNGSQIIFHSNPKRKEDSIFHPNPWAESRVHLDDVDVDL